jgi:hypothetical protein
LVWPTKEDLGGKVPAQLAAKGALDRDGLKWKVVPASGHIAAAPLASDDEQFPLDGWESECHPPSIGEVKAKIIHKLERRRASPDLFFLCFAGAGAGAEGGFWMTFGAYRCRRCS